MERHRDLAGLSILWYAEGVACDVDISVQIADTVEDRNIDRPQVRIQDPKNLGKHPSQLNFRSDGILPNACALDIAASIGNVHAVKSLVKKGAHLERDGSRVSALRVVKAGLDKARGYTERKNLERCAVIVEHWDDEGGETKRLANDWTNMRTIDESHVNSSWEVAGTLKRLKEGVKS